MGKLTGWLVRLPTIRESHDHFTKKIEIMVERTKTGYSAYAQNYTVATTGDDLVELKSNMVESIN